MSRSLLFVAALLFTTHISFGAGSQTPSRQNGRAVHVTLSGDSSSTHSLAVEGAVRFSDPTDATLLTEPDVFAIAAIGASLLLVGKVGRNHWVRAALRSDSKAPKSSNR